MSTHTPAWAADSPGAEAESRWSLWLYVAGRTPKCVRAFENLKRFCETHIAGRYEIEVVDLLEQPRLAREDQIIGIPTLVRKLPRPVRKMVGDLSNSERMRSILA